MSTDSDAGWQTPCARQTTKRQHPDSPKIYDRKRIASTNSATTSKNNNKFSALDSDDCDNDNNEQQDDNEVKPPPIILPNVVNVNLMIADIVKVIKKEEYTYKASRDGQIRLMIKSIHSYRAVVKFLDDTKRSFHTYQPKQERAYRVVLKGLHFTTPISEIKNSIEENGHKVRNISNIRNRKSKQPMSMFFVDLEPNSNNKEIYNLKDIGKAIVKIEPPLKTNDIVQCHRCQLFGHTKSFCRNPFCCVKCGLSHNTTECTKPKEVPPQCINCLEKHPASYRGCKVYRSLVLKRKPNYNSGGRVQYNNNNNINTNNMFFANNEVNDTMGMNQRSYANVAKYDHSAQEFNNITKIEMLLQKQAELTNTLLNMMSMLLSKLCN